MGDWKLLGRRRVRIPQFSILEDCSNLCARQTAGGLSVIANEYLIERTTFHTLPYELLIEKKIDSNLNRLLA